MAYLASLVPISLPLVIVSGGLLACAGGDDRQPTSSDAAGGASMGGTSLGRSGGASASGWLMNSGGTTSGGSGSGGAGASPTGGTGGSSTGGSVQTGPTDITGNPVPNGDPPPANCGEAAGSSSCIGDVTGTPGSIIDVPFFIDFDDGCGDLESFNLTFEPAEGLDVTLLNPIAPDSEEERAACVRRHEQFDGFYVNYNPGTFEGCSETLDEQGGFLILRFQVGEGVQPGDYEWNIIGWTAMSFDGGFCSADELLNGTVTITD